MWLVLYIYILYIYNIYVAVKWSSETRIYVVIRVVDHSVPAVLLTNNETLYALCHNVRIVSILPYRHSMFPLHDRTVVKKGRRHPNGPSSQRVREEGQSIVNRGWRRSMCDASDWRIVGRFRVVTKRTTWCHLSFRDNLRWGMCSWHQICWPRHTTQSCWPRHTHWDSPAQGP